MPIVFILIVVVIFGLAMNTYTSRGEITYTAEQISRCIRHDWCELSGDDGLICVTCGMKPGAEQ